MQFQIAFGTHGKLTGKGGRTSSPLIDILTEVLSLNQELNDVAAPGQTAINSQNRIVCLCTMTFQNGTCLVRKHSSWREPRFLHSRVLPQTSTKYTQL